VTLARTRALDRWRRASAHRKAVEAAEPEPAGVDPGPHEDAVRRELRKKLGGALESLDAKQRQVLEIASVEGLTQSEIAERLATPLGTIKYWTMQGLLKLREALPGDVWP
jgi:RNA polymerase sigma-70 factor (ECF subfamily)